MAEEETLMMELSGGAEAEPRPCDYYGDFYDNNNNNLVSINGDNGVLSFDDDIIDLLLDESEPGHVFTSCGGEVDIRDSEGTRGTSNQENLDCLQSYPSVESFLNFENQINDGDELIDWNCVCEQGNDSNLWNEKEGHDSMVSWLLDGDDETTLGKSNCDKFGESLDLDEDNALVAWLLS